jgi:hypothetical protein
MVFFILFLVAIVLSVVWFLVAIVLSVVWFLVAIVLSGLVSCGHSIVCGLVPPLISKELFLYKKIFHKYHFMTVESAYSQYVP